MCVRWCVYACVYASSLWLESGTTSPPLKVDFLVGLTIILCRSIKMKTNGVSQTRWVSCQRSGRLFRRAERTPKKRCSSDDAAQHCPLLGAAGKLTSATQTSSFVFIWYEFVKMSIPVLSLRFIELLTLVIRLEGCGFGHVVLPGKRFTIK